MDQFSLKGLPGGRLQGQAAEILIDLATQHYATACPQLAGQVWLVEPDSLDGP
jgi:hypothetical protein